MKQVCSIDNGLYVGKYEYIGQVEGLGLHVVKDDKGEIRLFSAKEILDIKMVEEK